jgi:hypothetical protein
MRSLRAKTAGTSAHVRQTGHTGRIRSPQPPLNLSDIGYTLFAYVTGKVFVIVLPSACTKRRKARTDINRPLTLGVARIA